MYASLGILVIGRHIKFDADPVWRYRLDGILKEAIANALPDHVKLAISTDFPFTPFISQEPRPPARFVLQISQNEFRPFDASETKAFLRPIAEALTKWIRDSHCEGDPNPIPDLLIEIETRGGTSEHHFFPTS